MHSKATSTVKPISKSSSKTDMKNKLLRSHFTVNERPLLVVINGRGLDLDLDHVKLFKLG